MANLDNQVGHIEEEGTVVSSEAAEAQTRAVLESQQTRRRAMKFLFGAAVAGMVAWTRAEALAMSGTCERGDCQNGWGVKKRPSGQYEGNFRNGLFHGRGAYIWKNGDRLDAEFDGDNPTDGILQWQTGHKYTGQFKSWKKHGNGEMKEVDGDILSGEFKNDRLWNGDVHVNDGRIEVWANGGKEREYYPHTTSVSSSSRSSCEMISSYPSDDGWMNGRCSNNNRFVTCGPHVDREDTRCDGPNGVHIGRGYNAKQKALNVACGC